MSPLPMPTYASEGWLLDEDRALRDHMKGMIVSDGANSQRNVEAWFGHPDIELREQKYPYVTVDLIEINEGLDRVHRGTLYLDNDPPAWWGEGQSESAQYKWIGEMPTPVDLIYQVGTWSRNPRHDRQLLTQCIVDNRTSLRGGMIRTADGFVRRLDFLGHVKRDREEGGKRLFNNIFRLRMSSEVPFQKIEQFRMVESVHLNIRARADDWRGTEALDSVIVTEQ